MNLPQYNRFFSVNQEKKPTFRESWKPKTDTFDPDNLQAWRTGDGVIVIDIDVKPDEGVDGRVSLKALEKKHQILPDTPTVTSMGGVGFHKFFKHDPALRFKNTKGKIAKGIDVRTDGGYVVWCAKRPPEEFLKDLAPLPEWLTREMQKRGPKKEEQADFELMANEIEIAKIRHVLLNYKIYDYDDYQMLVEVGMMCKSTMRFEGREIWDAWAEQSDKYDAEYSETKWSSFKANGDLTYKTILKKGTSVGCFSDFRDEKNAPPLVRTGKDVIKKCVINIEILLRYHDYGVFEFNEVASRYELDGDPLKDCDYTRMRLRMSRELGVDFPHKDIVAVAESIAKENSYNPIKRYFDTRPKWDGKKRLDTFFTKYVKTSGHSAEYVQSITQVLFVGAIARLYQPGCKLDNLIVFEGRQGIFKSTLLNILSLGFFTDNVPVSKGINDKDVVTSMNGSWFVELQEVDKLIKKCPEDLKQFLSTRVFTVREAYARYSGRVLPRYILIGSTNFDEYLLDSTGNRRYLPIKMERIDVERIEADLDQLWAEAKSWYDAGCPWWLDADDKGVLNEQEDRKLVDPLDDMIHAEITRSDHFLQYEMETDVYRMACEVERLDTSRFIRADTVYLALDKAEALDRKGSMRFAASMRRLGFVQTKSTRIFLKGDDSIVSRFYVKRGGVS